MKPAAISTAFLHLGCMARTRRIRACAVQRTQNLTTGQKRRRGGDHRLDPLLRPHELAEAPRAC
jgi:hypothetical protein